MVDTDDLEIPQKKPEVRDLEVMSIEALQEYIAEMEAEIERVRAAISSKESARVSAESVFKSG